MRSVRRLVRGLGTAMLAVLVVGSGAVTAASPAPSTTVVSDALERLADLASYRYDISMTASYAPDIVTGTSALIIQQPAFAMQLVLLDAGEPAYIQIVDGDEAWTSTLGSPFVTAASMDQSVPEEPPSSLADVLDRWSAERIPVELVGPESIDGVATLHHRGEAMTAEISPDPNGYYQPTLRGTLDLWVDAERGHLVRAVADVTDVGYGFSNRAGPVDRHVEIRVSDVDDPGNRVSRPPVGVPLSSPEPGDPALAPLVSGAFTALRALDSYQMTAATHTSGWVGSQRSMVINRPVQAARVILTSFDDEFIAYQAIGDRLYTRKSPDHPWVETAPEDMPTCDDVPCGFESAASFRVLSDAQATSFRLIGAEEIEGVPVTHLRSDAPMDYPRIGPVPQTTDLWIATEGGHVLRMEVDGVGQATEIIIDRIDDPENVIEAPAESSPRPAASGG